MSEQLYMSLYPRSPRCVISIQARMASKRLPGKVLAKVMGRPLLAWQIDRLKRGEWPVWVALGGSFEDDVILNHVLPDTKAIAGYPNDPPRRHLAVARQGKADVLGFCGADQTLVSAEHFERAFREFRKADPPDYVRVVGLPHGLHVWAVSRAALEACVSDPDRDADEVEHTGAYWDRRPERFRTVDLDMGLARDYRLTVDTPEDLEVHRLVMEALPDVASATTEEIVALMDAHPEWAAINANVSQYFWQGAGNRPKVHA